MNSDCTRTKLSVALLRKGRPGEDRRDRNLKLSMPKVRSLLLLAIPALLHLCSPLLAGPSRLLLREFDRAISRWVVRDSEGIRYLLTARRGPEGRAGFALRISRNTRPRSLEDFLPPTDLVPPRSARESMGCAGMALDGAGRLHFVWSTEKGLSGYSLMSLDRLKRRLEAGEEPPWVNPADGTPGALILAEADSLVGDVRQAPNGDVWLAWTAGAGDDVSLHLGSTRGGKWESFEVAAGNSHAPPALLIDSVGRLHLAWHNREGRGFYLSKEPSDLQETLKGSAVETRTSSSVPAGPWRLWAYRPALVETPAGILAVHESGTAELRSVFPGGEKKQHFPLTGEDERFAWDFCHSPRFAVDRYGIPWVFFVNGTRQHVFYARWLEKQWSPILNAYWLTRNTPRMDENHLSIERLAVEERMAEEAEGIGVSITHESRFPKTAYHTMPVPALTATPGTTVLFLDLKELQALDGLRLKVNEATKYEGNPVIGRGAAGDFDAGGASQLGVLKENGVYRMWYSGVFREPGSKWPESGPVPMRRIGYAESQDGYDFEKVDLGMVPFGGRERTNLVPGLPPAPVYKPIFAGGIHRDAHEADPAKRYKLLKWDRDPLEESSAPHLPERQRWTLFTSPDGIQWRQQVAGNISFPAGQPGSFVPMSLFFDEAEQDPGKRYKAYGFTSLNISRRGGAYGYSPDAVHWTGHPQNPIFDPFARSIPVVRSGKVEQIHDAVVWKRHGYYLALYQYQHSGTNMDVELAASRDGEYFVFIQPGEKVITRGAPGAWDSDMVAPSVPLVDGEDIKLYYGGWRSSPWAEGQPSGGVATLRLDGFTHLELVKDRARGSLTTIPIGPGTASELYVNADCSEGGSLQVELIDPASGRPLPGYSREESPRFEGDSLAWRVEWEQGRSLDGLKGNSFQIKFHLAATGGSPKLYSFSLK